jgi:hypothetical protein
MQDQAAMGKVHVLEELLFLSSDVVAVESVELIDTVGQGRGRAMARLTVCRVMSAGPIDYMAPPEDSPRFQGSAGPQH